MAEDFLTDFDALSPEKRFAKIGGETIDVTFVPARSALKFIGFSKKYDLETIKASGSGTFDPAMLEDMLSITESICKRSSEKITKDWLLDNVEISILMKFITYVFAGLNKGTTEEPAGESGKNLQSGT